MHERLLDEFGSHFGSRGGDILVRRAPGRTNLIGGHVDYSGGLVLPAAVNRYVEMAARPRGDRRMRLRSVNFSETFETDLNGIDRGKTPRWAAYILGVVFELHKLGIELPGCDLAVAGDVPVGSGLSSSAALEVCSAVTFLDLLGAKLSPLDIITLCRRAENDFVGVKCGIMDQFASCCCREDHALLIDCKTLEAEQVPLKLGRHAILLVDTRKERSLGSSAYNERVEEVAKAVAVIRKQWRHVRLLADTSVPEVTALRVQLGATLLKRALHVTSEIARVREGVEYVKTGKISEFGQVLYRSHESLRDLYEVSCAELDFIVDFCREFEGVAGARLTGGGFGGSIIALIQRPLILEFKENLGMLYTRHFGHEPGFIEVETVDGACAGEESGGGNDGTDGNAPRGMGKD